MNQRLRPIDGFQRVINSFKHFENKLDKLQEDVSYQGKTLTELRAMVTNLSGATIISGDIKKSDSQRYANKMTTIQCEDKIYLGSTKLKGVNPVPQKQKGKSFQNQKFKASPKISPFEERRNKMESGSKGISPKHAQRPKKTDAQRKTNTIRPNERKKIVEKKRVRPVK